jgi:hypothetical protein
VIIYLGGLGDEVGVELWVKSFITRHSFVYMVQVWDALIMVTTRRDSGGAKNMEGQGTTMQRVD